MMANNLMFLQDLPPFSSHMVIKGVTIIDRAAMVSCLLPPCLSCEILAWKTQFFLLRQQPEWRLAICNSQSLAGTRSPTPNKAASQRGYLQRAGAYVEKVVPKKEHSTLGLATPGSNNLCGPKGVRRECNFWKREERGREGEREGCLARAALPLVDGWSQHKEMPWGQIQENKSPTSLSYSFLPTVTSVPYWLSPKGSHGAGSPLKWPMQSSPRVPGRVASTEWMWRSKEKTSAPPDISN